MKLYTPKEMSKIVGITRDRYNQWRVRNLITMPPTGNTPGNKRAKYPKETIIQCFLLKKLSETGMTLSNSSIISKMIMKEHSKFHDVLYVDIKEMKIYDAIVPDITILIRIDMGTVLTTIDTIIDETL